MKNRGFRLLPLLLIIPALLLSGCAQNEKTSVTDDTTTSVADTETTAAIEETSAVTEAPTGPVLTTQSIYELNSDLKYTATAERIFTFESNDPAYRTVQGGYFNGEKFYIAVTTKNEEDSREIVRILVLDSGGNNLRESDPLPLDHANCITYNPDENLLLVSHCESPDEHYNRYSKVDPESLEIVESGDLEYPFFAMGYSAERKQYASGQWAGSRLDIWDSNLQSLLQVKVETPDTLSQGVCCDKDAIYFVRSARAFFPSEIRIYDWECNLNRIIRLNTEDSVEPESINIVDGRVYVVGNDWAKGCGVAFLLTFNAVEE